MKRVLASIVFGAAGCGLGADPATSTTSPPQPMVSPELVAALRAEKFTVPVPAALLADKPALVRQLQTFVDGPKGEAGSETAVLRRRAVIFLGVYGGSDAVPALQKLVANEKEEYRRDAVVALGRTGTDEGVAAAAKFLTHDDELYREAAIDGLAAAGRPAALDALKKFDPKNDKPFIQRKHRDAVTKLTAAVEKKPKSDKP